MSLHERVAETRGMRLVGRIAKDGETGEQGGILVVGWAEVHDFTQGLVVPCPPRIIGRWRWNGRGGAGDVTVDGHVEIVARIGRVQAGRDVQGNELKLDRIGVHNATVEAVIEANPGGGCDWIHPRQESRDGKTTPPLPIASMPSSFADGARRARAL